MGKACKSIFFYKRNNLVGIKGAWHYTRIFNSSVHTS